MKGGREKNSSGKREVAYIYKFVWEIHLEGGKMGRACDPGVLSCLVQDGTYRGFVVAELVVNSLIVEQIPANSFTSAFNHSSRSFNETQGD